MKIHDHDGGHMTKMATMSIYGKTTLKIFPGTMQWADCDETLCEASANHYNLIKSGVFKFKVCSAILNQVLYVLY